MSEIDYQTRLKEKAEALIHLADELKDNDIPFKHKPQRIHVQPPFPIVVSERKQFKSLGRGILGFFDSGFRPYILMNRVEQFHQMIDREATSDKYIPLIDEISSLTSEWFESVASEDDFERYSLRKKIQQMILSFHDDQLFSSEDRKYLEPLGDILLLNWRSFTGTIDGFPTVLNSEEEYRASFKKILTILDFFQESFTFLKKKRAVQQVIYDIKMLLHDYFVIDMYKPKIIMKSQHIIIFCGQLSRKASESDLKKIDNITKFTHSIIDTCHSESYFEIRNFLDQYDLHSPEIKQLLIEIRSLAWDWYKDFSRRTSQFKK
jgi:hypothetical protein